MNSRQKNNQRRAIKVFRVALQHPNFTQVIWWHDVAYDWPSALVGARAWFIAKYGFAPTKAD